MFSRLGRWCYRHRWIVVASWVGVLVVFGSILGVVGTETASDPELPDGEEAQIGVDLLEEHFGGAGAGASSPLTFVAEDGYDDPDVREAMEELFAFIESGTEVEAFDEGDIRVTSPYTEDGEQQIATDGPLAEQLAYADVELPPGTSFEDAQELAVEIRDEMPEIEGLEVALGGQMFAEFEEPTAEIIGVAFAIIILIVVFGSVIAMGLPIGTGLAGIGVGSIMAGLLTHVLEVPDFAQMLGVMIGLGVGIDYALFIVTRYRENRHKGQDTEQAIAVAINTAGRAVMFAGITVVISLMGMLIMQLGFITGMATSAATVVLVTMIASLTLLPALIGLVGDRIEVTRWRGLIAAGFVSLALLGMAFEMLPLMAVGLVGALAIVLASFAVRPLRDELPPRKEKPLEESVWFRWSRLIQHHPWPAALVGIAVLVLLAIPVAGLRLGFADEGNAAEGSDARVAYDLVAEGFGPGSNGPLILVAEVPEGTEPSVLLGITETLGVHVPEAGPMTVLGPLPASPRSSPTSTSTS